MNDLCALSGTEVIAETHEDKHSFSRAPEDVSQKGLFDVWVNISYFRAAVHGSLYHFLFTYNGQNIPGQNERIFLETDGTG